MSGVVLLPAQGFVEHPHHFHHVVADILLLRRVPVKQVQQLELEAEAVALHDDVVAVQVSVVLAGAVNAFESLGERVEKVQASERRQPLARLPGDELRQHFAFDVVGDQVFDHVTTDPHRVLGVVLDHDGAVPQLVQLLRVQFRYALALVSLGEHELRRALDAGLALAHQVDLAFPSLAEERDHLVLAGKHPSRREPEAVYPQFFRFRHRRRIPLSGRPHPRAFSPRLRLPRGRRCSTRRGRGPPGGPAPARRWSARWDCFSSMRP